jgi:hypothetical protein
MRKLILLVLACVTFLAGNVKSSEDVSPLIRRAYYDVLGVFPCYNEIEWFCTYNYSDSYEIAVEWLINHPSNKWNIPKNYMKMLLLSEQYKNQKRVPIPMEDVYKNLFYVVGNKELSITKENILLSSEKLIKNALKCGEDPLDVIDYMTNCLISRTTTIKEANELVSIYKSSNKISTEMQAWMKVLEKILQFDDIKSK